MVRSVPRWAEQWKVLVEQLCRSECIGISGFYSYDLFCFWNAVYGCISIGSWGSYSLSGSNQLYRTLRAHEKKTAKWGVWKNYNSSQLELTSSIHQLSSFQTPKTFRSSWKWVETLPNFAHTRLIALLASWIQSYDPYVFFPKGINFENQVFFRVMDPLVEQFGKLRLEDKGVIDP